MQKTVGNLSPDELRHAVTGLILAGGQGKRFDGRDKGLVEYQGRAMLWPVIEIQQALLDKIIINANRNLELYQSFGYPVIDDLEAGFKGPLAGILAGLMQADTSLVYVTPCDMPGLSLEVLLRMYEALHTSGADLAVASLGKQIEPVVLLLKSDLADTIKTFLDAGGRRAGEWVQQQNLVTVGFDDHPEWFMNINTPQDAQNAPG